MSGDHPGCEGTLHPQAVEGLRLFNLWKYFEAHEALETAWSAERGEIRDLYRGILQAAVVYLHIRRGNYQGAVKVYARCQKWLSRWPETCRGVAVDRLLRDLAAAIAEVRRLGPENIANFDPSLYQPVSWKI